MKQLIITVIMAVIATLSGLAQNSAIDQVFDRYAMKDGITVVDISGKMMEMLREAEPELQDLKIDHIRILTVEDQTLNAGLSFYDEIVPNLEMSDYNRLLDIREAESQVVILQKKAGKSPGEFILVTGGDDNTLICIEGDINFASLMSVANAVESSDFSAMSMDY
ncbi:MAG: DUF4252 domain-containing protein [Bacteroidales bacterium]|nr:DUF4252 domain-containing protein [Bacteroidales bacterium]